MGTEILERRFAAIGARIKVVGNERGVARIDVRADHRGKFFEVRFAGRGHAVDLEVVDVARAERHLRPRDASRRRNAAYVRQGEWFFVPAPGIDPPVTLVLFDEPLSRGRGQAHLMQFAHRRGGEVVWVSRRYPRGLTDAQYRGLARDERRRSDWSRMVRDPEVFAKGAIRHPDHATVVLRGWHRVAMNTEHAARAMRHAAFLD